jgi:hypothetical protein
MRKDEVLDEWCDVFRPLAKRRDLHAKAPEPRREIWQELSADREFVQGNVRRGHKANVDANGAVRANRPHFASLDCAKQLFLNRGAGLPNLIEQERSTARGGEMAYSALARIGERTLNVPEQFRTGDAIVERSQGDFTKGLRGSTRDTVYIARDPVLTRSRFTFEHHYRPVVHRVSTDAFENTKKASVAVDRECEICAFHFISQPWLALQVNHSWVTVAIAANTRLPRVTRPRP